MASYNNLIALDRTNAKLKAIASGDTITFPSDLVVSGNLTVNGTTTTVDSEIITSDAYVLMNSETTSATAQKGGLVIVDEVSGTVTSSATAFTADSGSGATITTASDLSGGLASGKIVVIQGAVDPENNGLFQVASATSTTITLETLIPSDMTGILAADLTAATGQSATVALATISVLRSNTSGGFEVANGNDGSTISFASLAQGSTSVSLQQAYTTGNSIQLANTSNFEISSPASGSAAVTLTPNANSSFAVSGANLSMSGNSVTIVSDTGNISLSPDDNLVVDLSGSTNNMIVTGFSGSQHGGSVEVRGRLQLGGSSPDNSNETNAGYMLSSTSSITAVQGYFYGLNSTGVATAASADSTIIPLGVSIKSGGGSGQKVATLSGSLAWVQLDSAPASTDYGKPVYLASTNDGATAGESTLTAPTTAGDAVYRIGTLLDIASDAIEGGINVYKVALGIQHIADN